MTINLSPEDQLVYNSAYDDYQKTYDSDLILTDLSKKIKDAEIQFENNLEKEWHHSQQLTIACIKKINTSADPKARQNALQLLPLYITTTKKVKKHIENQLIFDTSILNRAKRLQQEKLNAVEEMQTINDASKKMIKEELTKTFADSNQKIATANMHNTLNIHIFSDKIQIAQSHLSRLENKANSGQ